MKLIFFIILFYFSAHTKAQSSSIDSIGIAISHIEDGNFQSALSIYNNLLDNDSSDIMARLGRATLYITDLNDRTRACEDFYIAAQLGDESAKETLNNYCSHINLKLDSIFELTNQQRELGNYVSALSTIESAIKIDQSYYMGHIIKAQLLSDLGDLSESANSYKDAISLESLAYEGYYGLGLALQLNGNMQEDIIPLYEQALYLNPECSQCHLQLGLLHYDKQEFQSAINRYNKALGLNPNSWEALLNRGVSFENTGKSTEAISDMEKALLIEGVEKGITHFALGLTYLNIDKVELGCKNLILAAENGYHQAESILEEACYE
jgi:Tfp pilus assembly protein PilF